jgi:hypothetical protein
MEIEIRICQTANVYYLWRYMHGHQISRHWSLLFNFLWRSWQPAPRIQQHSYMPLLIVDLRIQFHFIIVFTLTNANELHMYNCCQNIPILPNVRLFFSFVRTQVDFWPGCTKCIRLIEWWMPGGRVGGQASLIGYLLCVINSSHTF